MLATAGDPGEEEGWGARLREANISSITRGHRPEDSQERRPSFSGVDVYVPAALLREARALLAEAIAEDQLPPDDAPFPWMWMAVVPFVMIGVIVAAIVALVA